MQAMYVFSQATLWEGRHPLRMKPSETVFGFKMEAFEVISRSDPAYEGRLPPPHAVASSSQLISVNGRCYEVPRIEVEEPMTVRDRGSAPVQIPSFPI